MSIDGLSKRQKNIATLLWEAESWEETEFIVGQLGVEAEAIRELIVLEAIDELVWCNGACKQAEEILSAYK
jgi:hypothetical protein